VPCAARDQPEPRIRMSAVRSDSGTRRFQRVQTRGQRKPLGAIGPEAPERVVSCAQLTTRPRLPRASRGVRAAQDASSHGDEARASQVGSSNLARTVRAKLAWTAPSRSTRSTEGHRVTPRVVRSAHDTRRTYVRPKLPKLPGPVRARLVSRAGARDASRHAQKRERRKPSGD
jgi:hypothetical protein